MSRIASVSNDGMDSSRFSRQIGALVFIGVGIRSSTTIPGVGLLTATALVAAVGTDVTQFRNGRQLAAWMGLTPYEHSSGNTRRLGHITRAGDRYLRTLLTHGARSVLQAAARAQSAGRECTGLKAWALAVRDRSNQNKATCALANKLAHICFATLRHQQPFDAQRACKPRPATH